MTSQYAEVVRPVDETRQCGFVWSIYCFWKPQSLWFSYRQATLHQPTSGLSCASFWFEQILQQTWIKNFTKQSGLTNFFSVFSCMHKSKGISKLRSIAANSWSMNWLLKFMHLSMSHPPPPLPPLTGQMMGFLTEEGVPIVMNLIQIQSCSPYTTYINSMSNPQWFPPSLRGFPF